MSVSWLAVFSADATAGQVAAGQLAIFVVLVVSTFILLRRMNQILATSMLRGRHAAIELERLAAASVVANDTAHRAIAASLELLTQRLDHLARLPAPPPHEVAA